MLFNLALGRERFLIDASHPDCYKEIKLYVTIYIFNNFVATVLLLSDERV